MSRSDSHQGKKTVFLSGVSIPLGALRSAESCGIGEYPDLKKLGDFCKNASLDIIQLLPVNDTGTESSPYSALSAFALHPVYARLQDIPEGSGFSEQIQKIRNTWEKLPRYNYSALRREKLELLRSMYEARYTEISRDAELKNWIADNSWIRIYAVYMEQKRLHSDASWKTWKTVKNLSKEDILVEWNNPEKTEKHLFFAWLQMRLHQQFLAAADYLKSCGIILKGDIPIMMNEDSCDTWAYPEFFQTNLRAGSPPDNMNPCGQNWGFPIYNWKNLKKADYVWWTDRLKHAAKYYDAYRIDHILGFFRIWAVPETEYTAICGYPVPVSSISEDELMNMGFAADRLRWLTKPHVSTRLVEAANNNDYLGTHGLLHHIMDKIGNEELWLFKPEIRGEKDIYAADLPDSVKDVLAAAWRDKLLLETGPGQYTPLWTWQETTAWKSLRPDEQQKLRGLFDRKKQESEDLWKKQALELLSKLTGCVSMLPCAEDLGANPESVPSVLSELGILGLRVVRWTREWNKQGCPYIPFENYPALSVTTSSVHDSSTLRGWWLEEGGAKDFIAAFPPLTADGREDRKMAEQYLASYTPETARYVLERIAGSAGLLCIHPVQDYLDLYSGYYPPQPSDERVNIPGSVTDFNWTYRMNVSLEELQKNSRLIEDIREIAGKHSRRQR